REHAEEGVHLADFPRPLAALSAPDPARPLAHRFESHVRGRELANGYRELCDADEQRRRFEDVNGLRASLDLPALPLDEAFLEDLRDPGLPPCAGVALGLDRLVLLATGRRRLADVAIELGAPGLQSPGARAVGTALERDSRMARGMDCHAVAPRSFVGTGSGACAPSSRQTREGMGSRWHRLDSQRC